MNDITISRPSDLAEIVPPEERGQRIAALDAIAKHAARIKDESTWRATTERALAERRAASDDYRAMFPHVNKTGGGPGRGNKTDRSTAVCFTAADYCAKLAISQDTIQRWHKKLGTDDGFAAEIERLTASFLAAVNMTKGGTGAHVGNNSGENEWYTPPEYIEAARAVMGGIDVDPASCEAANATVDAATFYTMETNGLEQGWPGRVWMNPPYAQPLIGSFIHKLGEEVGAGRTEQAIVLVNNATDTAWGQSLIALSSAVCFKAGRIRFIDKDGVPSGAPLQGQIFAYMGDDPDRFREIFEPFGLVLFR